MERRKEKAKAVAVGKAMERMVVGKVGAIPQVAGMAGTLRLPSIKETRTKRLHLFGEW